MHVQNECTKQLFCFFILSHSIKRFRLCNFEHTAPSTNQKKNHFLCEMMTKLYHLDEWTLLLLIRVPNPSPSAHHHLLACSTIDVCAASRFAKVIYSVLLCKLWIYLAFRCSLNRNLDTVYCSSLVHWRHNSISKYRKKFGFIWIHRWRFESGSRLTGWNATSSSLSSNICNIQRE